MTYCLSKAKVLEFVIQSPSRVTPRDVQKGLSREITRREVKTALKELISEEQLLYTYDFGCTFVESSMHAPVGLTDRIVMVPPDRSLEHDPDKIYITLRPGIAFGNGQHPTTCLVLKGMEHVFSGRIADFIPEAILDIGTGSGILALAGIKLGGKRAIGIDLDPNAVFEARENVALNSLEDDITILKTSLDFLQGSFQLVLANLRAPTLKDISQQLTRYCQHRSVLIMSGFYPEETKGLLERYKEQGWSCLYRQRRGKWGMAIFCWPT